MSKRSAPTSNPTTPKKHKKGERDEVNELDQVQMLEAVEHIGNQIEEVQARLKSLDKIRWDQPEQTHNFINHDLKLLMILEEQKQFFLQKIEDLNEMNNSPKQVMDQVRESQKIFDEFKNEFNVGAVSNFADVFDVFETLKELEKMDGPEFRFEMGKHESEQMDVSESPWDTQEQSSTAQRRLYTEQVTSDTLDRELEDTAQRKQKKLEYIHMLLRANADMLYLNTATCPELPELDDEYTMPDDEAMPDAEAKQEFSSLDTDDKLDDFDALRYFQDHHKNHVENLEDKLIPKQEKEIQELRELKKELKKIDKSKSGELVLRL